MRMGDKTEVKSGHLILKQPNIKWDKINKNVDTQNLNMSLE